MNSIALFLKDQEKNATLLSLVKSEGSIGKSLEADVKVNDYRCSGIHAYIETIHNGKKIRLVDLGSRSGVYVDGVRTQESELESGQSFVIGTSEIEVKILPRDSSLLKLTGMIEAPSISEEDEEQGRKSKSNRDLSTKDVEKTNAALRNNSLDQVQELLQVSLFWGEKPLEVRTFEPGCEITIGAGKEATFNVAVAERQLFKIAKFSHGNLWLYLPLEARGLVWMSHEIFPVEQLKIEQLKGKSDGFKLKIGDRADIHVGELSLEFRFVNPPKKIGRYLLKLVDRKFAKILGFVLLFYLAVSALLLITKTVKEPEKKTVEKKMPEKLKRVFYEIGIRNAQKTQEAAIGELSTTGGRARGEEGASKSRKAPEQKQEQAAQAKKETKTGPQASKLNVSQVNSVFANSSDTDKAVDESALISVKESGNTVSAIATGGDARGRIGLGSGGGGEGVGIGQIKGIDTGGGMGAGDYGLTPSKGREIEVPQTEDIRVEGGLDPEVIAAVIQRYLAQIRQCYESRLVSNPDLKGKVLVYFKITGAGTVDSSQILQSSLQDHATETCILSKVNQWVFPKPKGGGSVGVKYPFILMSTRQ